MITTEDRKKAAVGGRDVPRGQGRSADGVVPLKPACREHEFVNPRRPPLPCCRRTFAMIWPRGCRRGFRNFTFRATFPRQKRPVSGAALDDALVVARRHRR